MKKQDLAKAINKRSIYNNKLTYKQAVNYSIRKWKQIVKKGYTPELLHRGMRLNLNCGLCDYFDGGVGEGKPLKACSNCPLKSCAKGSLFYKWWDADYSFENEKATKYAIKILEKLSNLL
jgi:hypothetical protein